MTTRPLADVLTAGYVPDRVDEFDAGVLDRSLWLPSYLPQWSSAEQAAARYHLGGGRLHLLVDQDQAPWCPELDGDVRVSSLQTGVFAGPLGSAIGQHRFDPAAVVREEQDNRRLFTPEYGVVAVTMAATDDPASMVAFWMIGYEDEPERSAEICVAEIFGRDVDRDAVQVGMGVHPFGDPRIADDFEKVRLPIDAREFHEYAVEWVPERVTFFVDGAPVRTVHQAPDYPMQVMLGIYEFRDGGPPRGPYPKRFVVDRFRAFRPR